MLGPSGHVLIKPEGLANKHEVPTPVVGQPLAATYKSLEDLLAATFIAECASTDSTIKLLVNEKHELWAHILKDVTRAEGGIEISFGRGERQDNSTSTCTSIPMECTSGTAVMFSKEPLFRCLVDHPLAVW